MTEFQPTGTKVMTCVLRLAITLVLLYLVFLETGWATATLFALCMVGFEVHGFVLLKTLELMKQMLGMMERKDD